MSTASRLLLAVYLLIILIWGWSALQPSHYNWGFHLFAFYPTWYTMLCLGILLILLLTNVRSRALSIFQRFTNLCSRRPTFFLFVLLGGVFAILMYLFPAKLHLLGDGDIILQLTPKDPNIKDVSGNFRDYPLMYYIVRSTQFIIGGGSPVDVDHTYRIIDLVSGLLYLGLVFVFIHFLKISALEKALIGCLMFISTKLQFFFGYVENYSILSLSITAYMISGWLVFKNQTHSVVTFLCFIIMLGFHLGCFVFLPTLFVILFYAWQHRRKELAISGILTIIGGMALYFLSDLNIQQIAERFESVYHNELLPVFGWHYAVFSRLHFLDWINAHGLIMPFSLLGIIIFSISLVHEYKWNDHLLLFLFIASGCGLVFTLLISPALGMAHDWDLIATFFIPLGFLFVYFILEYFHFPEARHVVLIIIVIQFIQTATWIGINGEETRNLKRAEMLTDPSLSGTIPRMYYESLAKLYWGKKDYRRSAFWYERYLTVDSLNPRILANLADVYKKSGENEKAFEVLKRSAGASRNPAIFSNLGVEYLKRNDTTLAIQMFQNALKIDSSFAYAHANLSLIYTAQHKNSLIAYHATRAVTFGMTESILFKLAGNAFLALNDIEQALKYYNLYFAKKPDDANILSMIEKLQEELLRRKQSR